MTEQQYFDEPLTLTFTAEVTESRPMKGNRFGLVLPRTYFYPTSGGQEHDTGSIGEARVLDVYKQEDVIIHECDKSMAPGEYHAHIDRLRRVRAMQHHTAQHILSAAFLEVAGIDSLSANINSYSPSTIDLDVGELDPDTLSRTEMFGNEILFENRMVMSYYVNQEQVPDVLYRKPPKVSGRIRVVEVDGLDCTPCGGTHCPTTGMVGLLKIVRIERVNQKVRVHFVAGYQALELFEDYQKAVSQVATLLETGLEGVPAAVQRKLDQLKAAQSELEVLRGEALAVEAERLVASAEQVGDVRLVTALFQDREGSELRRLAQLLRDIPGIVALLAGYADGKLTMMTTSNPDSEIDARELLQQHLSGLDLRGGGDSTIAQGGGHLAKSELEGLFKKTRAYILGTGTALS